MSNTITGGAIAFDGFRCIAKGPEAEVARAVKAVLDAGPHGPVLVFDAVSSHPIEWDLRGTADEAAERVAAAYADAATDATAAIATPASGGLDDSRKGPGRKKLGVVAREVTLLPRHWEWLATQPGGASVTLRKLVESARGSDAPRAALRKAQESAYRFMSVMAGNQPGFEESTRALFAADRDRLHAESAEWPVDLRSHALDLASRAFDAAGKLSESAVA